MSNNSNTRFTTTLPVEYLKQLKEMADTEQIPSINFAIREAIELYLKNIKKKEYEALMEEASQDKEFLERTLDCDKDFEFADSEVPDEW